MTIAVIWLTVVILGLYDIYALYRGGFVNTISWQIYFYSKKYPIIPFAIGILMGHIFWNQIY